MIRDESLRRAVLLMRSFETGESAEKTERMLHETHSLERRHCRCGIALDRTRLCAAGIAVCPLGEPRWREPRSRKRDAGQTCRRPFRGRRSYRQNFRRLSLLVRLSIPVRSGSCRFGDGSRFCRTPGKNGRQTAWSRSGRVREYQFSWRLSWYSALPHGIGISHPQHQSSGRNTGDASRYPEG